MKVMLTKQFIIETLRKEPLEYGRWFTNMDVGTYGTRKVKDQRKADCVGCAVGALMCNIVNPTNSIRKIVDNVIEPSLGHGSCTFLSDAKDRVEQKRWIPALSSVFEGYSRLGLRDSVLVDTKLADEVLAWDDNEYRAVRAAIAKARTIAWVRQHFPDEIVLDLDGLKPLAKKDTPEGVTYLK